MADTKPISKIADRRKRAALRNLIAGRGFYSFQKTAKGLFYQVEDSGKGKLVYQAFAALEEEIGRQRADREGQLAGLKDARTTQPSSLPVDRLNYSQLKAIVEARSFYHGPVRSEVRTLPPSMDSNALLLSEALIAEDSVEVTFPDGVSMKYPKSHPLAQKLVTVQGRLKEAGIDLETEAEAPLAAPGLQTIAEEKTKGRRAREPRDPNQADKDFLQKDVNVPANGEEEEIDESDAHPTVNGAVEESGENDDPSTQVKQPAAAAVKADAGVLTDWYSFVDTQEEYVRVKAGDGPNGPIYTEQPQMVDRRFFAGKYNGVDVRFPVTDITESFVTLQGLSIKQRDGALMFIGNQRVSADIVPVDPALFFAGFKDTDVEGKVTQTIQHHEIPLSMVYEFRKAPDGAPMLSAQPATQIELSEAGPSPVANNEPKFTGPVVAVKRVNCGAIVEIGGGTGVKHQPLFVFDSESLGKKLAEAGLEKEQKVVADAATTKPVTAARASLWDVDYSAIYHKGAVLRMARTSSGPVFDTVIEPWGTPDPDARPGSGSGVVVIRSDKDGNPVEGAEKRWHCTKPFAFRSGYDGLEIVKSADPRIPNGTLSNDPAFLITPFSMMGGRMLGELSEAERADVAKRVRAAEFHKALAAASRFEPAMVPAGIGEASKPEPQERGVQTARPKTEITGTLISFGAAPYKDQPENTNSYFVEVADEKNVATKHWGLGLREALETAKVKAGEKVRIEKIVEAGVKKNKWKVTPSEVAAEKTVVAEIKSTPAEEELEIAEKFAEQKKAIEAAKAQPDIKEKELPPPAAPVSATPQPVEKAAVVEQPPAAAPSTEPVQEVEKSAPAPVPAAETKVETVATPVPEKKPSVIVKMRLNERTPSSRFPTYTATLPDGTEEVRTFPEEIGVLLEQQCVASDVLVQMEDVNGEMLPTGIQEGDRMVSLEELKTKRAEYIKKNGRSPVTMPRIKPIDLGKAVEPEQELGD